MESILEFLERKFLVWMMILSRMVGLIVIAPYFSGWYIPMVVKIWLSLFLSWTLLSNVQGEIPLNTPVVTIALNILLNFIVGLGIGFLALLPLAAFGGSGSVFSIQMGFAVATTVDPTMEETPIIGEFMYVIALTVFVILNGHLLLFQGISDSFKVFPVNLLEIKGNFFEFILDKSSEFFYILLKIGLPMIGFMLITTIALGIVSRLIPQMNVFMVGLPLKTLVGFILFLGMIPIWAEMAAKLSVLISKTLEKLLGV